MDAHVLEQSTTTRRGEKMSRFVVRDQIIVTLPGGDVDLESSIITIKDVLTNDRHEVRGDDMPVTLGGIIEVIDISPTRPDYVPGEKRMSSVIARDLVTKEEFFLPFKLSPGETLGTDEAQDSDITYDTNPTWALPYYGP
tara:strand:+ start:593 stop:1012 length:420 start_codon:yes stop_codon:yes gene_type:complete